MATKQEEIIIESCPMNGGGDTYSYSQHSVYQRSVLDSAKKLIQESIKTQLDISSLFLTSTTNPSFHIADFGCSVGPNTFISVHNILEAVRLKTQESKTNIEGDIEFQVFFCDQTNNDFNTLFRSLPTHQNYYAAGVPGSFHGRLFPEASLHFGCISSSLHWLS
ncbi:Loganic acid O-methyltransferase [Linum perenne]